jgi:lysophospholipid acyltransferase (LPLAT)-like uncharacterized protein
LNWLAINLFGKILLPLLVRSWRIQNEISDDHLLQTRQAEKMILAFWHNRQIGVLALASLIEPAKVLVSRHGDGEIISQIVSRFGIGSVRGSSTRGGVRALRQLITETHSSHILMTPDGPVGPRYRLKGGTVALAALTGRPIYWISFGVDRAWIFNSWDRFILPKPFARLRFRAAGPITIAKGASEDVIATATAELQTEMQDQTALLDEEEGHAVDTELQAR